MNGIVTGFIVTSVFNGNLCGDQFFRVFLVYSHFGYRFHDIDQSLIDGKRADGGRDISAISLLIDHGTVNGYLPEIVNHIIVRIR